MQVAASDDVGVTEVDCLINGILLASSTNAPALFLWDTTQFANGSYTIEADASDAAGNTTSAWVAGITVANPVPDTTAPRVNISSPQNGAIISKNFSVKVNASDDVGVARVELYLDGSLSGSSTSATASFSVNAQKLANGNHILLARAYDAAGNQGISNAVVIQK